MKQNTKQIIVDQTCCKGCHLCIDQCPKKVLEVSSRRNLKGYLTPYPARGEECSGCLLCEMICPDMAITVEGSEDEK